jgi:hypothetical protein
MRVIVFSSDVEKLRGIGAVIAPDIALLRDPTVFCGEVENCDAVLFLEPCETVEAAYQWVTRYELKTTGTTPPPEDLTKGGGFPKKSGK